MSGIIVAYLPEVLHDRITLSVAAVVSVFLPVVDVNVCDTTNEQLELALVEDIDQIGRNELVEALHKGVELLVNTLLNAPLCDESAVTVSKSRSISITRVSEKLTQHIPSCSRSSLRCPYHLP